MHGMLRRICLVMMGTMAIVGAQEVTKTLATFDDAVWIPGSFNSAAGSVASSPSVPPGMADASQASMAMTIDFAGGSFQFFGASPAAPLVIPGRCREVSLWLKGSPNSSLTLQFNDALGNSHVPDNKKKKYEWTIAIADEGWQQYRFSVPSSWAPPISIVGLSKHNWTRRNETAGWRETYLVDALQVTTDISDVDPTTGLLAGAVGPDDGPPPATPLLGMQVFAPVIGKVFAGRQPELTVQIRSWLAEPQSGSLGITVRDHQGATIAEERVPLQVSDGVSHLVRPPVERFGLYVIDLDADFGAAGRFQQTVDVAFVPPVTTLSAEEHAASPYGLCVHGGRKVLVTPFADAGIRWYRDYVFGWGVTKKSKGPNRQFTGWPNHRGLFAQYRDRGLGYLPILAKSIQHTTSAADKDDPPLPSRDWESHLVDILTAFPDFTHIELDNEYDLHPENKAYEGPLDWANYQVYHRRFAEVVRFFTRGQTKAVENGRAGIYPDRLRACVASGAFDQIDVANIHHYCGAQTPEENIGNFNTSFGDAFTEGKKALLFFDHMRNAARAADSDGRDRECWITEFGWDDLAGPVVSSLEKAAYLQRGFMVIMAAGVDKGFWFFDFSGRPEDADNFFDGCGLLDHKEEPELALAAMAGIANALPAPTYLGDVRLDDNTYGMVFRNRGQLVAALWTLHPPAAPVQHTFAAERLQDWLGNPIAGLTADLGITPVYAIGLDPNDPIMDQIPYTLDSDHYLQAAAGDQYSVRLAVDNRTGSAALQGDMDLELVDGFTSDAAAATFAVPPGELAMVTMPLNLSPALGVGRHRLTVVVRQDGTVVKRIPLQIYSVTKTAIDVAGLVGEPGATEVTVRVRNQSQQAVDFRLDAQLPDGWSAEPLTVTGLAPGAMGSYQLPVTWTADGGDTVSMVRCLVDGHPPVAKPLPSSHRLLPRATGITIDGDLSDWPAAARIPDWMLNTTGLDVGVGYYAAWADDGLYLALAIDHSTMRPSDPQWFWQSDVFELCLGTGGERAMRDFLPQDHTFWMSPEFDQGRVHIGRWKRGDEIEATRYAIPNTSAVRVLDDDSYVMEIYLPATSMHGYHPAPGGRFGVSLLCTVYDSNGKRIVTWPRRKDAGILNQPGLWGAWHLSR